MICKKMKGFQWLFRLFSDLVFTPEAMGTAVNPLLVDIFSKLIVFLFSMYSNLL